MVYINKADHDDPHGLPKDNLEGSLDIVHHDYAHIDIPQKMPEEIEKLEHIYTWSCISQNFKCGTFDLR